MDDVVYIIGGGIAGLGAAHFARLHGLTPVILEATDDVGGRAGAVTRDGVSFEVGGKNFASDWKLFNGILRRFHPPQYDRQHPNFHIVIDGKLYGFDKKATLTNGLSLARGIGLRSALHFNAMLKKAAAEQDRLNYFGRGTEDYEKRYDHKPLSAHVPAGLADGPLRMFTVIMGSAEPDEFSYAILMLLMSSFGKGSHHSLPGTMADLFAHLSEGIDIRHHHQVDRITVENGRVKAIQGTCRGSRFSHPAAKVIVATPLHRVPRFLDLGDRALQAVSAVPYYPLALINADYEEDVFTPEMNSIMFDKQSPLGHCSANRMYKRHSVRFTLSGRQARPLLTHDDDTLLSVAEAEFRRVHPIPGKARLFHVKRHLDGLCAYGFNYSESRRKLLSCLEEIGGLALAGDYLFGHNMEGCLQSAMAAIRHLAEEPDAYLHTHDYPETGTEPAAREPVAALS